MPVLRTPDQAVRVYYTALSKHENAIALQCLAPETRKLEQSYDDSDSTNLKRLTNLSVFYNGERFPVRDLPGLDVPLARYDRWALVRADYDAVYRHVLTSDNGRQVRFVYLGRSSKSGRWEIAGIGTGP